MARVVVDVMLKPEILDPQGKAVTGALPRLGFEGVRDVRQGKRFELELDGEVDEQRLDEVHSMAAMLLANPVIPDFTVRGAPWGRPAVAARLRATRVIGVLRMRVVPLGSAHENRSRPLPRFARRGRRPPGHTA